MKKQYFNEYEEDTETMDLPNRSKKFHYVGAYYQWDFSRGSRKKMRTWMIGLNMVLMLLIFAAGFVNNDGSHSMLASFPYILTLFPLLYLAMGIYRVSVQNNDRIEHQEYDHSYRRIRRSLTALLCLGIAAILGDVIFMILNRSTVDFGREAVFFCLMLAVLLVTILFQRVQASYPCQKDEKEESAQTEGLAEKRQ